MGIYAFEIENSLIFSIESTKLKYKTVREQKWFNPYINTCFIYSCLTMFCYTFGKTQLSLYVYFLTQANKRHEFTYEDKHGMKGAIKVRECLQVPVGKAWVNYSAQFWR